MEEEWTEDLLIGPMDLLDIPESIFELYENEVEPISENASSIHSLYCSTNCSRWPSISSALDEMVDAVINEDNFLTVMPAPPSQAKDKPSIIDFFETANELEMEPSAKDAG